MGVVRRRQPGPDVQELPDTRLCDQEVHRPGQERPLRPDRDPDIRVRDRDLIGDGPVGREIVLAAQPRSYRSTPRADFPMEPAIAAAARRRLISVLAADRVRAGAQGQ